MQVFGQFGVGLCNREQSLNRFLIPFKTVFQADVHFQVFTQGCKLTVGIEQFLVEIVDGELQFTRFFLLFFQLTDARCAEITQIFHVFAHGCKFHRKAFFSFDCFVQSDIQLVQTILRRFHTRRERTEIFLHFGNFVRVGKLGKTAFVRQLFKHFNLLIQRIYRRAEYFDLRFKLYDTLSVFVIFSTRQSDFIVDFADADFVCGKHIHRRLNLRTVGADTFLRQTKFPVPSFVADGEFYTAIVEFRQADVRAINLIAVFFQLAVDAFDLRVERNDFIGNRRNVLFELALFVFRVFKTVYVGIRFVDFERI